MTTYPGLPGPTITPYLTREASREHYAPGTEFAIDRLILIGNTGTYSTRPITATPTARTSAPSRWPGPSTYRRWSCG
jgi:arylformamidase